MFRRKWERFKAYILLALIALSVLQVGILLGGQNNSFPISYLSSFFSAPDYENDNDISSFKGTYFLPTRIIVSSSLAKLHCSIGRNSVEFSHIWDSARLMLINTLKPGIKPIDSTDYSRDKWLEYEMRSAYAFEFGTFYKMELVRWLLDMNDSSTEGPDGIQGFLLTPSNNGFTLHIADDDRIHTYTIPSDDTGVLSIDGYYALVERLDKTQGQVFYNFVKEMFPNSRIQQDIFVVRKPVQLPLYSLETTVPQSFDKPYNFDKLAEQVLGKEKDNYDPDEDIYGAAILKRLSSVYRIYSEGLMEYKYLANASETDKGSVNEAFEKALGFIQENKHLVEGADLYLSKVEEKDRGFYTFTFDYLVRSSGSIHDLPVLTDKYELPGSLVLSNAVTIRANSKRVLAGWWVVREFSPGKESDTYDIRFESLLDKAAESLEKNTSTAANQNTSLNINGAFLCYRLLPSPVRHQAIPPQWSVTGGNLRHFIPLHAAAEKGAE